MVDKKVKKGTTTITGLVMSLLITIGVFVILFSFLAEQAGNNNVDIDSKYNDTYTRLLNVSDLIDEDSNTIQNSLNSISEADNTFQTAWNGLKGLGQTLKTSVKFISRTNEVSEAVLISTDVIPPIVKSLFTIGLIIFVVLLILSALTGGNPKV